MNKRYVLLIVSIFVLASSQFACSFIQNKLSGESKQVPESGTPLPADQSATAMPEAQQPVQENSGGSGACEAPNLEVKSSSLIEKVTLAQNVEDETMAPLNPVESFGTSDIFHAVLSIKDAPANTVFKSAWYAQDVGTASACNTLIDSNELTTDGTRNVDFNLTPESAWPVGTYRVELFVNGELASMQIFSVK